MSPDSAQEERDTSTSRPPMKVSRIAIQNFRLLHDVTLNLSDGATVLVGRNNTGKTTLAEALTYFLSVQAPKFELADFSTESYALFQQAWLRYAEGDTGTEDTEGRELAVRELLPEITLTVGISYLKNLPHFGPLSAVIVDLDPDCTEAIVQFKYALQGGGLGELFADIEMEPESGVAPDIETILSALVPRVPKLYARTITAIDPNDASNARTLTVEEVRSLLTVHFLKAQRGLDDEKDRPKDLIGKVFQALFEAATKAEDDSAQKETVDSLTQAVSEIERNLGDKVSAMMIGLIPALERFGYPGLNNPELEAETSLDIAKLLANYTSIRYRSVAGVSLPESYSGLGSRNLILILFTLLGYYREYSSRGNTPGLHLIFIEEPEAHLHPQMQEVFIEQLSSIAKLFPEIDANVQAWIPQFVVSTHSSHVANRAEFSAIRYFRVATAPEGHEGNHADILDLSHAKGLDVDFLHQYLTLTRSDLFFADKAILVEGTSERLIVPAAIRNSTQELNQQYVTLLEVGGAYAHIFFPLLDFIGIPTLVITDIDTVATEEGKDQKTASSVHRGESTSNATIKHWFSDEGLTSAALLAAAEPAVAAKGNRCLAYQVPEVTGGPCGRSFEDAFILANPHHFEFSLTDESEQDEDMARELARSFKKSEFALRFAIEQTDWTTPRYIQRGLDWLLNYPSEAAQEADSAIDKEAANN